MADEKIGDPGVHRGGFESVLVDQPVASTSYLSLLGFGFLGVSLNILSLEDLMKKNDWCINTFV